MENLDQYADSYMNSPYINENAGMLDRYIAYILEAMEGFEKIDALSLGIGYRVGSETIIRLIGSRLKSYTLVEGSEEIVARFEKEWRLPTRPTVVHSYFEYFQPDRTYDFIEMGFILEHVDDPLAILTRYRDFLSPDGVIAIAVPNARSLHRLVGHEAGVLDDVYMLSEFDQKHGHKRFFDLESITEAVTGAGLHVRHTRGLMIKPLTTTQLNSLNLSPQIWSGLYKAARELPHISNAIYIEATVNGR